MCGIAGIVSGKPFEAGLLRQMAEAIRHRGPDDEGYVLVDSDSTCVAFRGAETVDELNQMPLLEDCSKAGIGIAHRRLSILDLSAQGHQPVVSTEGKQALVFNGEIYNFKELRTELEGEGITFQSHSDTEVVFAALQHWGTDCFARFRGMWALAWLDLAKNEIVLSRDRFGIKPLYYSAYGGRLAFASEIKALTRPGLMPATIARDKLFEYLSFGSLAQPYAEPYAHLQSVHPGTSVAVQLDTLQTSTVRYYDINVAVEQARQRGYTAADFAHRFEESIRLHLRSDVPVGACLSGGLDSSAIVAAAASQMGGGELDTFTAGFPGSAIDESHYAQQVADCFGNVRPHFIEPKAEELMADLDKLIEAQDLPLGSTSVFAQWSVMKLAGQHGMKVLLDGQGADEVLGGYYNFAGLRLIGLLRRGNIAGFVRQYRLLKNNFTPNINTAIGRAGYYYLPASLQRRVRRQQRQGSKLIAPEYFERWDMPIPQRGGKGFTEHALLSLQYGLYELLRYEDRNSMAFSIESRVPFLDHPLVEAVLAMAEDEKLHDGWTKYPERKYLNGKVPDAITWRKDKLGFVTPQQEWKQQLMPQLRDYLATYNYPPELNAAYFQSLATQPLTDNTHLSEFWRAYSVLRWMEGRLLR